MWHIESLKINYNGLRQILFLALPNNINDCCALNWLTNDKVRPLEEKAFKKDQQLSLKLYVAYKNEVRCSEIIR